MNSKYMCNICDADKFHERADLTRRLGADPNRHRVVECSKCGHLSLYPIPTETDLHWIYSNYIQKGDRVSIENSRIKNVYPKKIQVIERYIPVKANILDIGAGLGGFVYVATKAGHSAIGIEFSGQQVKVAKENFNVELINEAFETFAEKSTKRFDVIHMHHVLEHIRNPREILKTIKHKLNDDGILILEVPNQFFWLAYEVNLKIGRLKKTLADNPYHHIHFFSPKRLRLLVESCGYEVLELNEPSERKIKLSYLQKVISNVLGYGYTSRIELIAKRRSADCKSVNQM